jgi:hypothetical protein
MTPNDKTKLGRLWRMVADGLDDMSGQMKTLATKDNLDRVETLLGKVEVPEGLLWVQSQMEPGYHELRAAGDQVIGKLRFAPRPAFVWEYKNERRARAEVGSLHWDFRIERKGLAGLLGIGASVPVAGSDTGNFAARASFITGTLELVSGRRFRWNGGAARSPSAFNDESGKLLVEFEPGSMAERVNTYVKVQPAASGISEWPLLVALGLYLRLAMTKTFRQ